MNHEPRSVRYGNPRYSVAIHRTPPRWWFRLWRFRAGPDHDRRNGWHFYVPLLRFTKRAKP